MDVLPTIEQVPFRILLEGGLGYVCGKIANVSATEWAKIAIISSLAQDILYLLLSNNNNAPHNYKLSVYAVVHTVVGAIEIVALRRMNLIATQGTLILSGFIAWHVIYMISLKD